MFGLGKFAVWLLPPFFIERCPSADARPVPFYYSSFYFPFIDMSLFKDRVVAMGKPHCNSSICNFCSINCVSLFRVFPCSSVANAFASATSSFRVNPWLMLLLVLISVASASALLILFPLRWVGL